MRNGKKLMMGVLPTFVVLLSMLLVACGGSTTSTTTPTPSGPTGPAAATADKQIFRYPMGEGDISTFDPALTQDTASDFAIKAVFTGLVEFNNKGEVIDQLAASHKVSTDGLTYTFTLKPNLKFSDGTPLTSKDVAYSINRVFLPATKSPVAYYLDSSIKDSKEMEAGKVATVIGDSINTPDANTITITLYQPAAYFLAEMTYDTSYVVEQKLIDKYQDKWTDHLDEGGGDGPFKVVSWSHTTGVEMVPNPNYYGAKPKLAKLEYLQSGNGDTTYKSYQAGQLDYTGIPSADLVAARTQPDYHKDTPLVTTYLAMNFLTKPFDNIKIREAFALAIDRDLINTTILKSAVVPTWNFVPKGMYGYNANLTGPEGVTSTSGDKAKAQALFAAGLKEAGYANAAALPPIKLTFSGSSVTTKNWIAAVVNMWQTVLGVTVTTNLVAFSEILKEEQASTNSSTGLQIWRAGWQADYPDPQDWLSIFFEKGTDYNQFNYGQNSSTTASAQQAVQAQLLKADVTNDNKARLALYNDAEQKIINDGGVIPLWQPLNEVLINPKVYGIVPNALEIIPPDDWSSIYITA